MSSLAAIVASICNLLFWIFFWLLVFITVWACAAIWFYSSDLTSDEQASVKKWIAEAIEDKKRRRGRRR